MSTRGGSPRVLVVSPHFDDAPLSLGQSLLDGALASCDVHVHVVFGRTNWTRWVHPTPGRAPLVSAWRRGEELLSSRVFGYRLSVGRVDGLEIRRQHFRWPLPSPVTMSDPLLHAGDLLGLRHDHHPFGQNCRPGVTLENP